MERATPGRPRKSDDLVNYDDAHYRVRCARGPASTHTCSCGAQAVHWAYQHTGDTRTDEKGRTFSVNVDDYSPMCRSCHNKMDHEHGRRTAQLNAARERMMRRVTT